MINFLVTIALILISSVISALLTPKPPVPKLLPKEVGDMPTAELDTPIPVVFGTRYLTKPNVVWFGDVTSIPIKKKAGGKS